MQAMFDLQRCSAQLKCAIGVAVLFMQSANIPLAFFACNAFQQANFALYRRDGHAPTLSEPSMGGSVRENEGTSAQTSFTNRTRTVLEHLQASSILAAQLSAL